MEFLIGEITDGIGGGGVRCGLIGEVGCSSPLTDSERKSLQAAAIAQQRTGIILRDDVSHHWGEPVLFSVHIHNYCYYYKI